MEIDVPGQAQSDSARHVTRGDLGNGTPPRVQPHSLWSRARVLQSPAHRASVARRAGETQVGPALSIALTPGKGASSLMAHLECCRITLNVIRAAHEARAIRTTAAWITQHEATLAIRGASGGHAEPRLAGMESRAVLIRLARGLARPLDTTCPLVETVPVVPALHAPAPHTIR